MIMTMVDICKITGGSYIPPTQGPPPVVRGITAELDRVREGYLFCSIQTERFAAQKEMLLAKLRGAVLVLGEVPPYQNNMPYIQVSAIVPAVQALAEAYRATLRTRVIGITGSTGKTTTKELLASILSQRYRVSKSEENMNNRLGLPMSVLNIGEGDDFSVLEMGISEFGNMDVLCRIARPDIGVILNIGEAHWEGLGSYAGVFREKTKLISCLPPDGAGFLNADDEWLKTFTDEGRRKIFFFKSREYGGRLPFLGEHFRLNASAAAAVAAYLGLTKEEIAAGIEKTEPVSGRCFIEHTQKLTLIEDHYNAAPLSMKAALELLSGMTTGKTAILGDMLELGERSEELHTQLGSYAASMSIDRMIFIGPLAESMYREVKKAGGKELHYYKTVEDLLRSGEQLARKGDTVLLKASRAMHFERLVPFLKSLDR